MAIDPKYTPIFTNVGLTKIANAMANGTKIVLDKFAIGDANATDYTPNATQFSLVHELTRMDLRTVWYSEVTAGGGTILDVSALVKSGTVLGTIREIGIYDKAGDLIIIARTPDRQTITADNMSINISYTTQISLANNEKVFAVTVQPSGDFVTLMEYNGHITDYNNPHGTTKAQVGLGLADNTADINKNVLSATKFTTGRNINGVTFDGTANIELEDRIASNIAAAATTVIGTVGIGDYIKITGAVNIASFGTAGRAGIRRTLRFDSALTIVNSANIVCPGGADIGVAIDTIIEVIADTTSTWRILSITHPSLSMAEIGYLTNLTSDAQTQFNNKAPLASPALTGTPTAPTATAGTNSTQLANTAFVYAGLALKADVGQTMYIGTTQVPINRASAAITLAGTSITGNSGTATKLATPVAINGVNFDGSAAISVPTVNSQVIKFDSGIAEGTDLYTFNGSVAKTLDIKAGTNVTLTKAAGSIIISANDTSIALSEITGLATGISTFLATPSSVNLLSAVTDETGTGSLVFATSPQLVTPNIGVATGTSFNGITGLSNVAPIIAGVATIGTSTLAARADHIHPVQTTVSGNAGTATVLATARNISATGDATATAQSFNGSADIALPLVLANSGVTAGSYSKVTVDAKGRVTAGLVPTMEDIPDATFKRSVRCATTANLVAGYASNVLTMSAVGAISIDGITIALNDRILIKDQTTALQNGIYVVTTLGTASVAAVFTRSNDANTSSKIASGLVAVDSGTLNGGKLYDNDFKTTDILGTTAMSWHSNLDFGHLLQSNSTAIGTVMYNGTTPIAGGFNGGSTNPVGTNRLNYDGYFYPTYINLASSAVTTTASTHVFVETGSDGYVRPKTLADFKTEMFASPTLVTPSIGVATGTSFNSITALSSTTPLVAGTAAIGTSTTVARADHVHPVQTTVSGSAGSVVNSEIIKFDSGTTEGTDLYTFNGSTAKTIDIKAGTNVTLTKVAGIITISANDTSIALTEITGLATGASTFLATPTSANLAAMLTDETGTGANVFANSPTLVTPNIGVANGTSLDLANGGIASTATTLATVTATALTVGDKSLTGSVELTIQATQGTIRQLSKMLITHDGTTPVFSEYGFLNTGATLATYDVSIAGNNINLLITGASATSTTYKVMITNLDI